MTKEDFKKFCKEEFCSRGFEKVKNRYFIDNGKDILCGIDLQKSNYGPIYYVNVYFCIKDLHKDLKYPAIYESDFSTRITVMTKKQKYKGEKYLSDQIAYEEYDKKELADYFKVNFDEWIIPAIKEGIDYIKKKLDEDFVMIHPLRKEMILEWLHKEA